MTMPTNEQLSENGICPICGWHIVTEDVGWTSDLWVCRRCKYAGPSGDFITLDDLQQQFADLTELEFNVFLYRIALCAEAKRRGPGAVASLCEYRQYTKQTINRLAVLDNLPDYLKCPDLQLGVYWQALRMSSNGDDVDLDKFAELVEEAIVNQWSLREFKEHHGVAAPDRRQPVFDGEAELVQAGEYQWKNVEVKVY
jgi:hypothetical protein